MRSLPGRPGADPAVVLRSYLAGRRAGSAKALAAKAVVLIDPENRAGEIVWPAVNRGSLPLLAPLAVPGPGSCPQEMALPEFTSRADRRGNAGKSKIST